MKFDSKYKIWLAASDDKDNRPMLRYVKVEETHREESLIHGRIIAIDGFVVAVIPCLLDPDDVTGLVHSDHLKQAAKNLKRWEDVTISLNEDTVGFKETFIKRYIFDSDKDSSFPDAISLVPRIREHGGIGNIVALNPFTLAKLAEALGEKKGNFVLTHASIRENYTCPWSPIIVEYLPPDRSNNFPQLPFGVIMPTGFDPKKYILE